MSKFLSCRFQLRWYCVKKRKWLLLKDDSKKCSVCKEFEER